MTKRLKAAILIVAFVIQGAIIFADESQDAQIKDLTNRIQKLDERVKRLEELAFSKNASPQTSKQSVELRERFKKRFEQDQTAYSKEDFREIENLYQIANKQLNTPEAQESLKKLIEKYGKANRTGCALLYLGQMSKSGEEKEKYLKQAIDGYGDCYYGDGVQVGAYARFYLGIYYSQIGKKDEASALFDEIRKNYADAVDHKGRLLIDIIPK